MACICPLGSSQAISTAVARQQVYPGQKVQSLTEIQIEILLKLVY